MEIFDKYLFEELVEEYERSDLTDDNYEALYIRFCHLNHLDEVEPYLLVMRYLGLGTHADPDAALTELKDIMVGNIELKGLYFDLKLCANPQDTGAIAELHRLIEAGYYGKYLKSRSNISLVEKYSKEEKTTPFSTTDNTTVDDKIHYKSMIFEGCGYSGLYFTTGDIDYLHAKVFIEPVKTTQKVSVRSQIYAGDEPFSKVFADEFTLKPGDTWFTTSGWGNKNFYGYSDRVYQWRLEINGTEIHSQDFRFYEGKIDKNGLPIKDVKLFASKASGALKADRDRYTLSFNSSTLEYIYFKCFINEPGEAKVVQIHIKVTCLEDDSVFCDKMFLQSLNHNTYAFWEGIGFSKINKWKKGLYKFTIKIGSSKAREGTFSIY